MLKLAHQFYFEQSAEPYSPNAYLFSMKIGKRSEKQVSPCMSSPGGRMIELGYFNIQQKVCPFKGTGTRDLIWLKVVSLERS